MQLIEAMTQRLGAPLADSVFQHDLWPVLDKAMEAGELLVARNTVKQLPVDTALKTWLEGCLVVIATVHQQEKTISKGGLLKLLYDLEASATRAMQDCKAIDGPKFCLPENPTKQ